MSVSVFVFVPHQNLQRKREEVEAERVAENRRRSSAVVIQTAFREHLQAKRQEAVRKERRKSAVVIQTAFREHLERIRAASSTPNLQLAGSKTFSTRADREQVCTATDTDARMQLDKQAVGTIYRGLNY